MYLFSHIQIKSDLYYIALRIWQKAMPNNFLFDSNKIICVLVSRVLPFLRKRHTNKKKGVLLNGEPPTKEKQTKQKYENEFIFFSRSSASLPDVSHHLVICPRDLKSLFRMCKGF